MPVGRAAAAALLLASSSALGARWDVDPARTALRRDASACFMALNEALGLALEPGKAAAIKAGLDRASGLAAAAAESARSLDAQALDRAAEMGGRGGPDRQEETLKALAEETGEARARWTALSRRHQELLKELDPKGGGEDALRARRAGEALSAADAGLRGSEEAWKAAHEASGRMKEARRKAEGPLAELLKADAGVASAAGELSPAVEEAKPRVDALAQEPRAESRTRAWQKLEPLGDVARRLSSSADVAANRALDFAARRAEFERAEAAFEAGAEAARSRRAAASSSLDDADRALRPAR